MYKLKSLVWLSKRIDESLTVESMTLWRALSELSIDVNYESSKREIFITGTPEDVYSKLDLFTSIPSNKDITVFDDYNSSHPAIKWMTIHYFPVELYNNIPEDKHVSLFVSDRLDLPTKRLLLSKSVYKIVSSKPLPSNKLTEYIENIQYNTFSYFDLLLDIPMKKDSLYNKNFINQGLPHHFKLQLRRLDFSNKEALFDLLDDTATYVLDYYWLQNKPQLEKWTSVLLREIEQFIKIKNSNLDKEELLIRLENWCYRDKSIN